MFEIEQESRVEQPEFMAAYRETENEDEKAAMLEGNRRLMKLQRELEEQREREDGELPVRNAPDHCEIVLTNEEIAIYFQFLT